MMGFGKYFTNCCCPVRPCLNHLVLTTFLVVYNQFWQITLIYKQTAIFLMAVVLSYQSYNLFLVYCDGSCWKPTGKTKWLGYGVVIYQCAKLIFTYSISLGHCPSTLRCTLLHTPVQWSTESLLNFGAS